MATIRLKTSSQYLSVISASKVITRSVTYSKISADDVLDRAAENSGINRGQLSASMHAILQTFRNFVCNGHSVELPELGTFRFSVNATAADSEDEAGAAMVYRRKVLYTPSKKVKNDLENISLSVVSSTADEEDDEEEDSSDNTDSED